MQEMAGKWTMQVSGQTFLVLSLKYSEGQLTGTMVWPKKFRLEGDGSVADISPEHKEFTLVQDSTSGDHVLLRGTDQKTASMELALIDHDHALLQFVGAPLPPWKLDRVGDNNEVTVATSWPEQKHISEPMSEEMVALAKRLHSMVAEDQEVRTSIPISAQRMREVDEKNYPEILRIYQKYGWPPLSKFGMQAAQDYWLLVQHQELEFQKMVLPAMEQAVAKMEASRISYAFLYDRVMVGEGKPQHWGTQGGCEDGKAILQPVDDTTHLEQRRRELGIFPVAVDDYLKLLAPQCANMKQDIPKAPAAN